MGLKQKKVTKYPVARGGHLYMVAMTLDRTHKYCEAQTMLHIYQTEARSN